MSDTSRPPSLSGREIREKRESLGWSQERLAEALGVHTQTLSKWERGVQSIRHPALVRAALDSLIP